MTYFCINILFILMSTLMVAQGTIEAIDNVRFLIVFQIPWSLPQLWIIEGVPEVIIHLSYRLYSIMFTSTVMMFEQCKEHTIPFFNTGSDFTPNIEQAAARLLEIIQTNQD